MIIAKDDIAMAMPPQGACNPDLLARIPPSATTVLDVGCGTGLLGAAYRQLNPRCRLLGIERDLAAAEVALTRLDEVAAVDVEREPWPFGPTGGLDCIVYGDVLQHLRDPIAVLHQHLELLRPDGTLLICIPNVEHWSLIARLFRGRWEYEPSGLLDAGHLRWFSLTSIMRALRSAGLSVSEVHGRVVHPEAANSFVETLVPALRTLNIDGAEYSHRAIPLQYVLSCCPDASIKKAAAGPQQALAVSHQDTVAGLPLRTIESPLPAPHLLRSDHDMMRNASIANGLIEVAYVVDDNYNGPFMASLYSLLATASSPLRVSVISLQTPANRVATVRLLELFAVPYRMLLWPEAASEIAVSSGRELPRLAFQPHYLRLFLGELLHDTRRVIYLDCDLIVRSDLRELWSTDLGGCPIGAVADPSFLGDGESEFRAAYGGHYFNSGVLLIDLDRWRSSYARDLATEAVQLFQRQGNTGVWRQFYDQSPLNFALRDQWHPLSPKWNFTPVTIAEFAAYYLIGSDEFDRIASNPAIFHFLGPFKPWVSPRKGGFFDEYHQLRRVADRLSAPGRSFLEAPVPPAPAQPIGAAMRGATILPKLIELYRTHADIEIISGLNPYHFAGFRDAPFTHFVRQSESLTDHLGISVWEMIALELLSRAIQPRSIYVVGNGLGWSTLGLALANPQAKVVAIDPDSGISLTNRLAGRAGLACMAVQASSPGDNALVINSQLDKPPDMVLIDGIHTPEAVVADFRSIFDITGRNCYYFFHDAVNFELQDGLGRIAEIIARHDMAVRLMACTPSGMAVVYPRDASPTIMEALSIFCTSNAGLALLARRAGTTLPPGIAKFPSGQSPP